MVFGDETLLKNHVRPVNGVDLEPGNGIWPTIRHFNQDTGYGSSAIEEDQPDQAQRARPKMECMQQCVKEQGDTSLCNVNKADKGTVSLDEEQGQVLSVQGHDVKCTTELRKHAVIQVQAATPKPRS